MNAQPNLDLWQDSTTMWCDVLGVANPHGGTYCRMLARAGVLVFKRERQEDTYKLAPGVSLEQASAAAWLVLEDMLGAP